MLLGGGGVVLLLSLVEISPVKINPWKPIRKLFKHCFRELGKLINAEVLQELSEVKAAQKSSQEQQQTTIEKLDNHIHIDDERNAEFHRQRILQFNNELLRGIGHSKEDFVEVLLDIDRYEVYCRKHPDYPNNRAVHAISNIGREYDQRLKKHDFLSCSPNEKRRNWFRRRRYS